MDNPFLAIGIVGVVIVVGATAAVMYAKPTTVTPGIGTAPGRSSGQIVVEYDGAITVYHDVARGVHCWYSDHGTSGAISCIPDAQLAPAKDKP